MSVFEMMTSGQLGIETVEDATERTNGDAGYCGFSVLQEATIDHIEFGRDSSTQSMDSWVIPAGITIPCRFISFQQSTSAGRIVLFKSGGRP